METEEVQILSTFTLTQVTQACISDSPTPSQVETVELRAMNRQGLDGLISDGVTTH